MKRFIVLPAIAVALLPFVATAPTAHAATDDLSTVSITVSMDLPSNSSGPIVFQVTDVPVAAGPELTGADVVSNPSDWGGSVTVDVDNATHHITVATEDSDVFETATVTVTSPGLGPITLVSDDLWGKGGDSAPAPGQASAQVAVDAAMPLTYGSADGTANISWTTSVAGVTWELLPDGAAVFSFEATAPTTTTTAPATTTTAPPAATQAVEATPAFTG